MDMNNFLQSEATQFVGTAAANTIGLVIGTIHEDIKELLEIPDEYQAISIVSSRTGTVAQAIAIDDAVKAVNAKLLRFEMAIDAGKQCGHRTPLSRGSFLRVMQPGTPLLLQQKLQMLTR